MLGQDVPDERVRELVLGSYELVAPKEVHHTRVRAVPEARAAMGPAE